MKFKVGYELDYHFPQVTPVIMVLNTHYTRVSDLERPDHIVITPSVPISGYRDGFGNWCSRILAPSGNMRIAADTVIKDGGLRDPVVPDAAQIPVHELPEEALVFLLGSRYCDSDRMLDLAWSLFGHTHPGWARVQAICDFVLPRFEHPRPVLHRLLE
jgi:transglutaminase-like putative cysteine protease